MVENNGVQQKRKSKKIAVIVMVIVAIISAIIVFIISIICTFILGYISGYQNGYNVGTNWEGNEEIEEVEKFFAERGYDIEIIGAHTNGREHEGPFSYGWFWYSFEINDDVIMLYPYDNWENIEDEWGKMNDRSREKCYVSNHFVFYYDGSDTNIRKTIIDFCGFSLCS